MEATELLDKIIECLYPDAENVILEANELLEALRPRHRFTISFKGALDIFAEEHNLCPKCGQELETMVFFEESEYMGSSIREDIYSTACSNPWCNQGDY